MTVDSWFHIEEIDSATYAISEYGHWEKVHSYLLIGTERAVLIDTGLGVSDIRKVVRSITPLPIFVVSTHVHWDHIGGHAAFECFAVHEEEREWISGAFPLPLSAVKQNLIHRPCIFPENFDLNQYQIFQGSPAQLLHDGDTLELGGRSVRVIHTPGHSPGHCCFYEPDRKYLYSGDLIYGGCLDAFYPTTDPILFYQSIQRVRQLDIQQILPGHYSLDISVDIIGKIEKAFRKLDFSGQLIHGSGIFDFGDFQIHI